MPKRTAETKAEAYRIIVREHPNVSAPEFMLLAKDFGLTLTKENVHNALSVARAQVAKEPKAAPAPTANKLAVPQESAMERLIKAAKEVGLDEANRIIKAIVE